MKKLCVGLCLVSSVVFAQPSAPVDSDEPIAVTECLKSRYSGRAYDATLPVSQQQIQSLIEAGRRAPSSYNMQPWTYIFCDKTTDPAAYQRALKCLVEFNQGWAKNAPLLIIAVAANESRTDHKANRWGQYDTGAASLSICVQAAAIGLMGHQMGGFDEGKVIKEFNIPKNYTPMAVIAVGYEEVGKEDHSVLSERLPIKDNFFKGKWGAGYPDASK